jgi:hypothetical protein
MDDVFEVPAHYEVGAEDRCQGDVRREVAGSWPDDPGIHRFGELTTIEP